MKNDVIEPNEFVKCCVCDGWGKVSKGCKYRPELSAECYECRGGGVMSLKKRMSDYVSNMEILAMNPEEQKRRGFAG